MVVGRRRPTLKERMRMYACGRSGHHFVDRIDSPAHDVCCLCSFSRLRRAAARR